MPDFLYARPTWIDGVMSLVDFFGTAQMYNESKNEQSADRRAFTADIKSLKQDAKFLYIIAQVRE